jgi:hypothetical protein
VTARKAGATGQVTVRSDSAYYNHDVIAAARTGGARFSITARMDPAVTRAITQIPDDAWVGIKYPHAIYDQDEHRWVSDAQVAEIAFTSRRRRTTRLRNLTTQPQRRNQGPEVEDPDRPAPHLRPNPETIRLRPDQRSPKADRWIEAQRSGLPPQTSDLRRHRGGC